MTEPTNLNNLLSVSETVVGLILLGKQTSTNFSADKFAGKYQNVVKDLQAGKTEEDLYIKYSNLIQPAKYAARSVNGMGEELNWVDVVNKAYCNEVVVETLDKAKKYFSMGDSDKANDLLRRATATLGNSQRMRSVSADEIDETVYEEFMKCGVPAWDNHIGGLPNNGVVILAAEWGVGKTSAVITLMDGFLREHPEKEVLFVTLEEMNEGWKKRASIMLGKRAPEFWHRVKIMEFTSSAQDIIQEASRYPDLGLVILDYINMMVKDENLQEYVEAYKTLSIGAKSLAVESKFRAMPVIVLAQFAKNYGGGVPTPNALTFAGAQFCYQLVMLYDPNVDFHSDNPQNPYTLPAEAGHGWVCVWKVKGGNRKHLDSPKGAIKVPMLTTGGFNLGVDGTWFSLMSESKRDTTQKKGR
jgi:hypothetical protein